MIVVYLFFREILISLHDLQADIRFSPLLSIFIIHNYSILYTPVLYISFISALFMNNKNKINIL